MLLTLLISVNKKLKKIILFILKFHKCLPLFFYWYSQFNLTFLIVFLSTYS